MSGQVDPRLGFSAQLEQCETGWDAARGEGRLADGARWLAALEGVLGRAVASDALRGVEASYPDDLRRLMGRCGQLRARLERGDGAPDPGRPVAPSELWAAGDRLFEEAMLALEGAGL